MKHIITAIVILNLAGCGWLGLRDRSNDYLSAEEVQATTVPSEMDSVVLGQIYPLPKIPAASVELGAFEVPRPQPVITASPDGCCFDRATPDGCCVE